VGHVPVHRLHGFDLGHHLLRERALRSSLRPVGAPPDRSLPLSEKPRPLRRARIDPAPGPPSRCGGLSFLVGSLGFEPPKKLYFFVMLQLARPVFPFSITQHFGDNLTCVDVATRTKCLPRLPSGTCPPGYESLYTSLGLKGHNGVDLLATHKQPVLAATEGRVHKLVSENQRGIGVEIVSKCRYQLEGLNRRYRVKTRYWHLDSYAVRKGRRIKAGEIIGYADNTGLSSGTHLHFELKPVRRRFPRGFKNVFQENGYFGAIDPEPYFVV